MPQSRQRKITKAKKRPKGLTPSNASVSSAGAARRNDRRIKTLAIVLAAAVLLTLGYMLLLRGKSQGKEVTTASGLKYSDIVEGSGPTPQRGQTLSVQYTGTLLNGTKFDSSLDHGKPMEFQFGVTPMIKGWDEGVATMKVGGKRKLIVPPALGYAAQVRPKIPANSTLVFEIELLSAK